MAFMQLYIYPKAELYSASCAHCCARIYAHPAMGWTRADLIAEVSCPECGSGKADPTTVRYEGKQYAGRYSADGYLDATDWHFSANRRTLARELRDLYGD